jgi:hypothetical protein
MNRNENVTVPRETERPLRDDELEAVNGGVNNANAIDALINTAGRAAKTEICYMTQCVEWPF